VRAAVPGTRALRQGVPRDPQRARYFRTAPVCPGTITTAGCIADELSSILHASDVIHAWHYTDRDGMNYRFLTTQNILLLDSAKHTSLLRRSFLLRVSILIKAFGLNVKIKWPYFAFGLGRAAVVYQSLWPLCFDPSRSNMAAVA